MALTPEQLTQAIARYKGLPASEPLPSDVVDPWSGSAPAVPANNLIRDFDMATGAKPLDMRPAAAAPFPPHPDGQIAAPPASSPPAAVPPQELAPVDAPPAALKAPRTFDQGMQAITTSAQQQVEALRDQAKAQAASNDAAAQVYGQQAEELAARQKAFEQEEAEYKRVNAETTEEFKKLNQQAENMRVVDRRGTTQKVMGVLGVALGGLGDAFARMGGNQNTNYGSQVQQQMNYLIERDMDLQREALQDKRKAAAGKLTELGLARSAFDDEQQAAAFASSQIQLKYASQLKQVAASTANPQVAAAAEVAATGLVSQATETQAKLIAERDKARLYSARQAGGGAGGGGAMSSTEVLRKLDRGEPMTKAEREFALKLDAGRDRDTRTADQRAAREAAAEDKRRKEGAGEGGLIPGYETIDSSIAPQGAGGAAKAKEIAAGVAGVKSAGDRMASLYEQIQQAEAKGDDETADLLRSRYYTTGGQFLVQKSLAGGQGVINASDAERDAKEGAVPPPPGAPASIMSKFTNLYKGVSPSADGIRSITEDVSSDGVNRLSVYNLRPKRGGGEAQQRVQAPTAAGQTGGSAEPKVGGMVRMQLPDGRVRDIPAENVGKAESLGAKRL